MDPPSVGVVVTKALMVPASQKEEKMGENV
jgi:hypothetical protein